MQVTDELNERLLRLPLHYEMIDADVVRICAAITQFFAA
jgi:dTDP-4-amino-4,6-dideoxygalactose transaminase